jgi:hypothetical protein
MKPQIDDLRTVTQRFDGEQWVLCLQSIPPRELSDEEIYEVWSTLPYDDQCPFDGRATYRFARAILKKASEK